LAFFEFFTISVNAMQVQGPSRNSYFDNRETDAVFDLKMATIAWDGNEFVNVPGALQSDCVVHDATFDRGLAGRNAIVSGSNELDSAEKPVSEDVLAYLTDNCPIEKNELDSMPTDSNGLRPVGFLEARNGTFELYLFLPIAQNSDGDLPPASPYEDGSHGDALDFPGTPEVECPNGEKGTICSETMLR
jgi:hypothetical protein